jgi:hypothetical protein
MVTSDTGQTLSLLIKFTTIELFPKSTPSALVRFIQLSLQVCLKESEKQLQCNQISQECHLVLHKLHKLTY